MSTYVISDIHGCFKEFQALLEEIQFNPNQDTLYILGDVIDRGWESLECLRFIMKSKSIHLLRGNHEAMMLDYFDGEPTNWRHNGGRSTQMQLRFETSKKSVMRLFNISVSVRSIRQLACGDRDISYHTQALIRKCLLTSKTRILCFGAAKSSMSTKLYLAISVYLGTRQLCLYAETMTVRYGLTRSTKTKSALILAVSMVAHWQHSDLMTIRRSM